MAGCTTEMLCLEQKVSEGPKDCNLIYKLDFCRVFFFFLPIYEQVSSLVFIIVSSTDESDSACVCKFELGSQLVLKLKNPYILPV